LSMKNDDEMYQSLLARFEKYQAKKRKQRLVIRCTVPAAVCLCIAAAGYGHRHSLRALPSVPVVTEEDRTAVEATAEQATQAAASTAPSATAAKTAPTTAAEETHTSAVTDEAAETAAVQTKTAQTESHAEVKTAVTAQPEATAAAVTEVPTAPPVAEKPVRTTQPTVTEPPLQPPVTEPPDARPFEPPVSPVVPADPGGPGGVYSQISVSYEEARERFGHPIVQCTRGDFTGYKAAMVSQNGDITSERAFCLEVIYNFNDGYLAVMDNERFGSASPMSDETVEYNGRTFYIGQPEYSYGQYYIGYFPSLEGGIVYQGFFADDCDIYEKMDIIISLLI